MVRMAWGAHVTPEFRDRVVTIATAIGGHITASDLMSCIAWESGETFSPSIGNRAGSGAVGLIQFMPDTAAGLGTTTAALAALSPVEQLGYVERYFKPHIGALDTLADLYMAILWPAAIGKPMSFVLWNKANRPTTYRQNIGLDSDKDGAITKAEAVAKVYQTKARGFLPGNIG